MKYERKCTNCGRTDHYYAKGLCRTCYGRMRRNGTFEKQYQRGIGSRPYMWSDNTKKILELYHGGMRQVDIVKKVGLTKQAVSLAIKKYTKPTNADKIKQAGNESEMASAFMDFLCIASCIGGYCNTPDKACHQCVLDWLKQEATDG